MDKWLPRIAIGLLGALVASFAIAILAVWLRPTASTENHRPVVWQRADVADGNRLIGVSAVESNSLEQALAETDRGRSVLRGDPVLSRYRKALGAVSARYGESPSTVVTMITAAKALFAQKGLSVDTLTMLEGFADPILPNLGTAPFQSTLSAYGGLRLSGQSHEQAVLFVNNPAMVGGLLQLGDALSTGK